VVDENYDVVIIAEVAGSGEAADVDGVEIRNVVEVDDHAAGSGVPDSAYDGAA
jgi:hypothetical protein